MLKNIINVIRGAASPSQKQLAKGFPKTLTQADLAGADTALQQDKETIIDDYDINPQTMVHLGFGGTENTRNQGNIYLDLVDTAAAQLNDNTEVRLIVTDYNGRVKGVAIAERYANLKTGATDPTIRFPFPEEGIDATENDKIRLVLICPDAGKTLDVSASKIFVSGTEYWLGQ